MEQAVRQALGEFFSATTQLVHLDVIQSFHYEREITRYLCQELYGFDPQEPRLPVGYDGQIGASQVRIRFNNCIRGFPVILEEPFEFDELIVVLGPLSALRPDDLDDDLVFYRFTREEALVKFKTPGGKYVGKRQTFARAKPDRLLNL